MASLSSVIKRDLSNMGKFLFIGMIMMLVAGIANIFIQSSALMITLSVLSIGIFSAFILHDLKRVQMGKKPTTSAPPWVCTSASTTSSSRCCLCWASSAAVTNKPPCLRIAFKGKTR